MMTNTTSTDNTDHDAELVARSLTGNRDAFGLIVSRYQSLVCSIAYSATGCLSRSEDLAQETFLTAWKQLTHDFAIGGNVIARHANDAVARELFERFHAAGIFQALLFAVTALSLGPVGWLAWRTRKQAKATAVLLCAALIPLTARPQTDTKDWPMYNRDLLGTRHNKGETVIGPANAGQLVEKWRFPAKGSAQEIGVIHATPAVVNGYFYFGTATDPAFYKMTPDGKVKWSYRNPARTATPGSDTNRSVRFQPSPDGIFSSALVTEDAIFFGDTGGWFYALDRKTARNVGNSTRAPKDFPGLTRSTSSWPRRSSATAS